MQLCETETYECEASLTDSQVLDFCKNGFLMLSAVVPDDINRKAVAFCDEFPSTEPSEILGEEWFVQNVICNPAAAGAIRSLLGADFHLPVLMSNHRRECPTGTGIRNLLKYFYWRTTPPQRDWIVEPDFDITTADYGSPAARLTDQFRDDIKVAEMFLWLCGQHDAFQNLGGQSWPLPADRRDKPYGCPTA
jgi:hypothetical protein